MQQLQAILWLQFRLFKHTLQGGNKLINTIVGIFNFVMLTIASLGLGIITYRILHYILQTQNLDIAIKPIILSITLDIFLIFITFVWISRSLFPFLYTENFDINKFLLFPFSFQRLYNINLFASALNPWMLLLYPALLSLWLVLSQTCWMKSLIFAISILIYLLLVIVWSVYLTYYLNNLFRSRKIMERFLLISIVLVLLLPLAPIINDKHIEIDNYTDVLRLEHSFEFAVWIITFTLPGLLAYNLLAIYYGNWLGAFLSLIALFLFTFWGWYRGKRTLKEFFMGKHKSPSAEEIKTTNVKKID